MLREVSSLRNGDEKRRKLSSVSVLFHASFILTFIFKECFKQQELYANGEVKFGSIFFPNWQFDACHGVLKWRSDTCSSESVK